MGIEALVVKLSSDPFNPELNFDCAKEYDSRGQTASAVSFYLRTAEYGLNSHVDLVYESLLRMSICFEDQNDRVHSVSNCILQAITVDPSREEGYFLMARFYERQGNWQECYTWASMGMNVASLISDKPNSLLDYPGVLGLQYEMAVSGWWIGRREESIELFELLLMRPLPDNYRSSIEDNLKRIKG